VSEQLLQQAQFVLMLVAFGIVEQGSGGQAEYADQLQEGKSAPRLLTCRVGDKGADFLRYRALTPVPSMTLTQNPFQSSAPRSARVAKAQRMRARIWKCYLARSYSQQRRTRIASNH
jgi:hypothetical protein